MICTYATNDGLVHAVTFNGDRAEIRKLNNLVRLICSGAEVDYPKVFFISDQHECSKNASDICFFTNCVKWVTARGIEVILSL